MLRTILSLRLLNTISSIKPNLPGQDLNLPAVAYESRYLLSHARGEENKQTNNKNQWQFLFSSDFICTVQIIHSFCGYSEFVLAFCHVYVCACVCARVCACVYLSKVNPRCPFLPPWDRLSHWGVGFAACIAIYMGAGVGVGTWVLEFALSQMSHLLYPAFCVWRT